MQKFDAASLRGPQDWSGPTMPPIGNAIAKLRWINTPFRWHRNTGAELFLVPPDNCASALQAQVGDEEIRLVRTPSVRSAVRSLEAFADDPDADLPECGENRE